ncbi:MAG: cell division protein FtsL [Lachnospiraceae bacterium]|nr:cell division protein FtsL [Lachnospiraceae bacterium]
MATTQRRGQARTANRNRTANSRGQYYVQGNVVRKLDVTREIQRQPQKKVSNTTRKNREKAKHMNAGYVVFLCAALVATGLILINYIGLQSDITNSVQHISALESQLNELKLKNDEDYSRITSSVDLEEIKRIAIQELGMQYAEEGQIVTFASENSDYVKQMADIPQ